MKIRRLQPKPRRYVKFQEIPQCELPELPGVYYCEPLLAYQTLKALCKLVSLYGFKYQNKKSQNIDLDNPRLRTAFYPGSAFVGKRLPEWRMRYALHLRILEGEFAGVETVISLQRGATLRDNREAD